jgi:hypothetical protein
VEFEYPVTGDPSKPLEPLAEELDIKWPPARLRLLALKEEKVLEVWAGNENGKLKRLTTYSILAASGVAGPKRREGDLQVPEGKYRLTTLNPQSRFHLSVRVDYPNATDLEHSKVSRNEMGGDIYVHGKDVSIGCIAIGDEAIERLYGLIAQVPIARRDILIAPVDFRRLPSFHLKDEDPWVTALYGRLKSEMRSLPLSGR